jgi:hypothetical protein
MMPFDLIWTRVVRVTSFVGGMAIMGYETIGDQSDRPWLYAAAIGMMGLPVARAAENVLSKLSSQNDPIETPQSHQNEK